MFERFTDRARSVLAQAQQEARRLHHPVISTEHMLLGLIDVDGGVAAKALVSLDISSEEIREKAEAARERSAETMGLADTVTGSPAFTRTAKKVLELALREALQLGHSYIGTEHILLGIVREGEGVGAQVLQSLGADLSTVRQQVIELLSGSAGAGPTEEAGSTQALHLFGPRSPARMAPICPQCRTGLAEAARFRVMAVAPGPSDRDKDPISLEVVYCTRCGVTLEMFKSEPPPRRE